MKEGAVHPEFQPQPPTESLPEFTHPDPRETVRIVGIVDIARPILDPKDLAQLHLDAQRIVRRILGMMGIEAQAVPSKWLPILNREPPRSKVTRRRLSHSICS